MKKLPSKAEIRNRIEEDFGLLNHKPRKIGEKDEELAEALDDKSLFMDTLKEFSKITKSIKDAKDPDSVLQLASLPAAKTMFRKLFSVNERVQLESSKEILNRTLGKPMERSMNLNADIHMMTDQEINNEIIRILGKLKSSEAPRRIANDGEGGEALRPEAVKG